MNLTVIEQKGQRVLTTFQLAESYGTSPDRISKNFNENKERYKEGKHFFLLQGEKLKQFKNDFRNSELVHKQASALYLWTEKGAWLHAKSLNTDEAWDAYEMLVDDYYNHKQNALDVTNLSPQLQALINIEMKQKEIEEKQRAIESNLTTVQHRLDNIDRIDVIGDLQQRLNKMIQRFAQQEGLTFAKAWNEFRTAFNTAYHTNLKAKMNNYKTAHGLKTLTMPQYLSLTNQLEDAIRVADKMLNQKKA